MSACMRSLYSSDQWAPGFDLLLVCGRVVGAVSLCPGDLRAPAFSLSVTRGDVGLTEEFELFIQSLAPISGCYAGRVSIELDHSEILHASFDVAQLRLDLADHFLNVAF